jgi:hypothetical protein
MSLLVLSRELWWMNTEWLELRRVRTIDQRMAAVHGTLCTIPSCNSNHSVTLALKKCVSCFHIIQRMWKPPYLYRKQPGSGLNPEAAFVTLFIPARQMLGHRTKVFHDQFHLTVCSLFTLIFPFDALQDTQSRKHRPRSRNCSFCQSF